MVHETWNVEKKKYGYVCWMTFTKILKVIKQGWRLQKAEELPVIIVAFAIRHHAVQLIHQFRLHLQTTHRRNPANRVGLFAMTRQLRQWKTAGWPVWSFHFSSAPSPSYHGKLESWCFELQSEGPGWLPGRDPSFLGWSGVCCHLNKKNNN